MLTVCEIFQVLKELRSQVDSLGKEKAHLTDKLNKQEQLKWAIFDIFCYIISDENPYHRTKDVETALNAKNKLESELKDALGRLEDHRGQTTALERQLSELREEQQSTYNQSVLELIKFDVLIFICLVYGNTTNQ